MASLSDEGHPASQHTPAPGNLSCYIPRMEHQHITALVCLECGEVLGDPQVDGWGMALLAFQSAAAMKHRVETGHGVVQWQTVHKPSPVEHSH